MKTLTPKIVIKKIDSLVPYLKNARVHDSAQVNLIAKSIKEFGFNNPILLDGDNGVIAGHGRLMAARKLKMTEVPCLELSHLSQAQRRAYILADNQIATKSSWDKVLLREEIDAVIADGIDVTTIGFNAAEINVIIGQGKPGKTDEDETPEPPENPVSRLGDIWVLGDHRVMCGDSTKAENVSALLGDAKPHLLITDPPYGVEYDANWRNKAIKADGTGSVDRAVGKVQNDNRADWREAWALFPGNIAYVWHAGVYSHTVAESLIACGYKLRAQIIWNKNQMCIGRGDYHWKHEPCFYAVKGTGKWTGDRKQTTVWDIDKPLKSETGHSTQKPVECMRRPMLNNSVIGDSVYDPFLGSGTTVIAAETEGRKCLGLELNPAYVDVICKRYFDFTGKSAILDGSEKTFDEVKHARAKGTQI